MTPIKINALTVILALIVLLMENKQCLVLKDGNVQKQVNNCLTIGAKEVT
jgi:hypothetical protein